MVERKLFLVRMSGSSPYAGTVTLSEVAFYSGLHPELVERLLVLGLIDAAGRDGSGELLFNPEVIPLVRRIVRLRNELGVNYVGVGVILELIARIESLENTVRELESRIFPGE